MCVRVKLLLLPPPSNAVVNGLRLFFPSDSFPSTFRATMSALATDATTATDATEAVAEGVEKLSVAVDKPLSDSWLDLMAFHVGKIEKTSDGEIPTDQWLNCFCDRADKCYDVLFGGGMIAGQLKSDINNSLTTVLKQYNANKEEYSTIEKMIAAEVKKRGTKECFKDKTSACIGQLWTYRALNFLCTYMEHLNTGKLTPPECGKKTYKDVLEMYHGFFARTAVGNMMGWCPTREEMIKAFGFKTNEEMVAASKRYVVLLRPLLNHAIAIMDKNGVNFPDKV